MAVFNNILAGAAGSGDAPAFTLEKSVRLNSPDDAYFSRTPSTAGNRKTWTWSSWVKLTHVGYQNLFANLVNNSNGIYVYWSGRKLYINDYSLTGGAAVNSQKNLKIFQVGII